MSVAAAALGAAILSPIPGDEILVGLILAAGIGAAVSNMVDRTNSGQGILSGDVAVMPASIPLTSLAGVSPFANDKTTTTNNYMTREDVGVNASSVQVGVISGLQNMIRNSVDVDTGLSTTVASGVDICQSQMDCNNSLRRLVNGIDDMDTKWLTPFQMSAMVTTAITAAITSLLQVQIELVPANNYA